jgi:hypothetical protein
MQPTDRDAGELVALDPSIGSAGVAVFRGGALVAVRRVTIPTSDACLGARCLRMAQEVAAWTADMGVRPRVFAHEWPQVYRPGKGSGDPNDLPPMAGVSGALAGIYALGMAGHDVALEVVSYTPQEWCAGTKKLLRGDVKASSRAIRIESRLEGDELPVWRGTRYHDEIDAIGIGLKALGRFEARRVYPGATPG